MKVAILGGSFDPPHVGHLLISQQVREHLGIAKVWLMPLFQKALQDKVFHKTLSPVEDRFAMAKLLENNLITVSDFEIKQNKKSLTFDTLSELEKLHPNDEFYWILGSDQLESFQKYYKWQELVQTKKLIIFPREHTLWHIEERVKEAIGLQTIPENVIVLQNKELVLTNISSSMIRHRVMSGLSIQHLVPVEVESYIKEKGLYV